MGKVKKTLHLNLNKKWFDMILSGEKTEEYREIKGYWIDRLSNFDTFDLLHRIRNNQHFCNLPHMYSEFDTITFSNGYAKDRPQFEIELESIKIHHGLPEWGANKDKEYFVLSLGRIIE